MSVVEPVAAPVLVAEDPAGAWRRARPAALISLALLGTSALAYVFTVLAARLLAPAAYGELAALTGLLLIGTVPATGLQTAAALELGGHRGDPGPVVRRLHGTAMAGAGAVAAVGALTGLPLARLLHLTDAGAVGWLLLVLVTHTLAGGYLGVLQGTGRYRAMAVVTASFGVTKLAGGVAGLVLGGTPTAAMAGMALGTVVGVGACWLAAGRPAVAGDIGGPARAALRASGALLGFVLLLNLDLLLARYHLSRARAGDYAVAAVLTKISFWLPQGVGVVLLPTMADADSRARTVGRAAAVVAILGAVLTLGTAVLGGRVLRLIGGPAYGAGLGGVVWLFALLGTLFAVAQLLLYSGIAAADRLSALTPWVAAAAECAVVEGLAVTGRLSMPSLVATAAGTAAVLVAGGLPRLRAG